MMFLSQIRYQDLLDIIICSYVVFRFYILFRGTAVFTVLIGLAFLWLFKIVSVWSGLIVTSYAIQGVTALAAIIIIVVFRNEIRRTLQATNLKTLLWGFPHTATTTPMGVIAESAFELARKRIGGLIVFPGRDDLKDYIHSGIAFDGLVSADAIISIFWKDNPIHDGAAVIAGNRIMAVRGILPLTKRQDLPSQFGTRHRAAIGLCEATDALVIVISEEQGVVRAVKGSQVEIVPDQDALSPILEAHTGGTSKRGRLLQNEAFRLGFAALVSVIVVFGAWLNLTKGLDTLTILQIPIEYKNQNARMEIVSTSVDTVRLFLKGSEALLKSIRPEKLKVNIDIGSATVGVNPYQISQENIILPPGIALKNVQPPSVTVTVDIQEEKQLPVQVDWVGTLDKTLILESATIYPQRTGVIGGSLVLREIETIYTEKVSLDSLTQSGIMEIRLSPPSANVKILSETPDTVTVTYEVRKRGG
ncbi:MAG: diadenylate cyclase [Desulfobacterales bacterium]